MRYFKPSGKEGTLIIGKYPIVSLAVARTKRDEAKALLLDNLDPMEEKQKAKIAAQWGVFSLKLSPWSSMSKSSGGS
ncbi:integrase arm-type DNA-binding domain-containing protein [Pseudomonas juntendi]|uniref:integrase arm-type DNA-binding domain-containing protein n=1 Tax=Pseudomonas juntendi TaxID=2666183 RepID=UPI003D15F4F3